MKNVLIALCALTIQLTLPWHSSFAFSQKPEPAKPQKVSSRTLNKREWRPANFSGLIMGKSTRLDMLQVLGEPKRTDVPEGQMPGDENPEVWYAYDSKGKIAGDLTVVVDEHTSIVLAIDLHPRNMTKEDVVKHFGPDYIVTRYDFDDCLGDEESAPLYESPSGSVLEVEYRHRGIAVSLEDDGKVTRITYVSKPIGAPKSKCKSSTARIPRSKNLF